MLAAMLATFCLAACVYRIDVQQGNLLEDKDIGQVEVGMTRSQVQFLLGTPMVSDSFHHDRWDYAYYFRQGRSRDVAAPLADRLFPERARRADRPRRRVAAANVMPGDSR